MIIVEGVDKVGKTTLVNALGEVLADHDTFHNDIPRRTAFEEHMECLITAGNKAIIDRLHWSEYCYGLTYRNNPGYTILEWNAIESILIDRLAIVIYMIDPNQDALIQRWNLEEKFSVEHLPILQGHYNDVAEHSSLQIYMGSLESFLTSFEAPTDMMTEILINYHVLQKKIDGGMNMSPKLRNIGDSIRLYETGDMSWKMIQGSVETPILES